MCEARFTHTVFCSLLAHTLSVLPLPEDYALEELRELIRGHMMDIAD